MASTENSQPGLYWTPKGGNNHEAMFASCHKYTSVTEDKESGQISKTTILIDMGQNEKPKDFAGGKYDKVVPALTDCLALPGQEEPKDPAAAIFLTHSHSDHIDAIFEYMQMGVKLPPIYGSEYTLKALRAEFLNRGIPVPADLEMKPVEAGQTVEIGNMKVETLSASHSVPGCLSFKLSNEEASIFHSGDVKSDQTSSLGNGVDLNAYRSIAGVDFALWDAAMADRAGHSTSEEGARQEYQKIFEENADKQIVVAMPAAHMERLASVIAAAATTGKQVVIDGGATMEQNVLALGLNGYDLEKICPNLIKTASSLTDADRAALDPKKTITITTGIYGEDDSPFVQKLQGEQNQFALQDDAVVITPAVGKQMSSAEQIETLLDGYIAKDSANRSGIKVITARDREIGSSGHAQHDDFFEELLPALKAKVNIPTHTATAEKAEDFMQELRDNGYGTLSEYPRNGYTVQVTKQGCQIVSKEEVKWIGSTYSRKVEDGKEKLDKQVSWKVEDDHGFSTGKEKTSSVKTASLQNGISAYKAGNQKQSSTFQERRKNASKRLEDWRRKNAFKKASMIKRRGRNDRE